MKTRYVLKLVKNENNQINPKLGTYAYKYKPDPEDCIGWFSATRFEHSADLFRATFFNSEAEAEKACKKYAPGGASYQLIKVDVYGKVLKRIS